eukprot:6623875-Lingulodinium_polyedra.AAC.1
MLGPGWDASPIPTLRRGRPQYGPRQTLAATTKRPASGETTSAALPSDPPSELHGGTTPAGGGP